MTEPTPTPTPTPSDDGGEPPAFRPITSQEDLDRIITDRVRRERAKYADHADLKAKAARLDEIEAKTKTEAERTGERIAALERDLAASRLEGMRARVQAKHGVSDDDAELFLTGTDEETLTRQAARLASRKADERAKGNAVPAEGTTPTVTGTEADRRALARQLFGSARE